MIFPNPHNRGTGKLTKAEREQLGSTLVEQGHNPTKELHAAAVMEALLTKAAKQHDAEHPGSNQAQAAREFCNNQR